MSPDTGGPAFPMQDAQTINAYASAKVVGVNGTDERDRVYLLARSEAIGGMTLRDYFAAKAMAGYLSSDAWREDMDTAATARSAYAVADAMLNARKT